MFFTLLIVTFVIAGLVSFGVVRLFDGSIAKILRRVVAADLSEAWQRYIRFAAYVVGVSSGVRIGQLERYISAPAQDTDILVLNAERWTFEVYRTVFGTLQGLAWMFLVVFVVALVAYVLARGIAAAREARGAHRSS